MEFIFLQICVLTTSLSLLSFPLLFSVRSHEVDINRGTTGILSHQGYLCSPMGKIKRVRRRQSTAITAHIFGRKYDGKMVVSSTRRSTSHDFYLQQKSQVCLNSHCILSSAFV